MQITTAKKYRRSLKQFKATATEMATLDMETAASCMYTLPRGNKPIAGPSVRLAEICASAWGNIRVDAKIVGEEAHDIVAEATCWDLENNVAIRIQNRRRIQYKNGQRFNDDMITTTGNAAVSIALRNAIFRVIPRAFVQDIYAIARRVAIGDAQTISATRANVIEYFAKMGVTPERICQRLERAGLEDVGLDDIAILKGFATAIRDGQTTVDECFPLNQPQAPPAAGMSGLRDKLAEQPEPVAQTDEAGPTQGSPAEETVSEPPMTKKRADLISAIDELDPEAVAVTLDGRALSALTDGQLKDLIRDLSPKK